MPWVLLPLCVASLVGAILIKNSHYPIIRRRYKKTARPSNMPDATADRYSL